MANLLRTITRNWKLKLLAFTLGILLWVVVSAEEVTSRWIDIPLQVRVTDPEFLLQPASAPREVAVRFAGPRRELIDLRFRRPPLILNILDVDAERQSFDLHGRMVQVPTQLAVNVVDIQPAALDLHFTRVETRTYPVRVRLTDPLPAGWMVLDTLQVSPARVRVSGPESRLAAIDSVVTLPVTLPRVDTAFTLTVPIDTTALAGLRLSVRRVQITGRVARVQELTRASVPVSVGPGISIRPTQVDVTLRGPSTAVQAMGREPLRVVVAIDSIPARIPPEGLPVPLRLERPRPGVQVQLRPDAVRLFPERTTPDTLPAGRPSEPADTLDLRAPLR